MRDCPYCNEMIDDEALFCNHCGREVAALETPGKDAEKKVSAGQQDEDGKTPGMKKTSSKTAEETQEPPSDLQIAGDERKVSKSDPSNETKPADDAGKPEATASSSQSQTGKIILISAGVVVVLCVLCSIATCIGTVILTMFPLQT